MPKIQIEWEKKRVRLTTYPEGKVGDKKGPSKVTQAKICEGIIAVHNRVGMSRSFDHKDASFVVTALNCECVICVVKSWKDAVRICEFLVEEFGDALELRERIEVQEALPEWFSDWTRKISQKGKWIDPEEFE